jgi:hypothetical protein
MVYGPPDDDSPAASSTDDTSWVSAITGVKRTLRSRSPKIVFILFMLQE